MTIKPNTSPSEDTPLLNLSLFALSKGTKEEDGTDKPWRFAGIASDEDADTEGDRILRKAIDVTYANNRGYVNWDHKRDPEFQLGFLTKCEVIAPARAQELQVELGTKISPTASVYVEGELYRHVPKAQATWDIIRSTRPGSPGLGLSLDGAMAVSGKSIVQAIVRGVAFSAVPVQTRTITQLRKSIMDASMPVVAQSGMSYEEVTNLVNQKVAEALGLYTQMKEDKMDFNEAVIFVMQKRPYWTYQLASDFVNYTLNLKAENQHA